MLKIISIHWIKKLKNFLSAIALNTIIANVDALKNDMQDKKYGFNIDFPSQKLNIGKFNEKEKSQIFKN